MDQHGVPLFPPSCSPAVKKRSYVLKSLKQSIFICSPQNSTPEMHPPPVDSMSSCLRGPHALHLHFHILSSPCLPISWSFFPGGLTLPGWRTRTLMERSWTLPCRAKAWPLGSLAEVETARVDLKTRPFPRAQVLRWARWEAWGRHFLCLVNAVLSRLAVNDSIFRFLLPLDCVSWLRRPRVLFCVCLHAYFSAQWGEGSQRSAANA